MPYVSETLKNNGVNTHQNAAPNVAPKVSSFSSFGQKIVTALTDFSSDIAVFRSAVAGKVYAMFAQLQSTATSFFGRAQVVNAPKNPVVIQASEVVALVLSTEKVAKNIVFQGEKIQPNGHSVKKPHLTIQTANVSDVSKNDANQNQPLTPVDKPRLIIKNGHNRIYTKNGHKDVLYLRNKSIVPENACEVPETPLRDPDLSTLQFPNASKQEAEFTFNIHGFVV